MKRLAPLLALALLGGVLAPLAVAQPAAPERWLHVRIDSVEPKGERVRVNLPLSLAEKVLPTVQTPRLRDGKVVVDQARVHGVNLRALLEAVRATRDGELVTVQSPRENVRVAKQAGYLLIYVREEKETPNKQVEIRVPMPVVDALLSAGNNELDLVAAVRALGAQADTELVMVKDAKSTVRIWLDSKSTAE